MAARTMLHLCAAAQRARHAVQQRTMVAQRVYFISQHQILIRTISSLLIDCQRIGVGLHSARRTMVAEISGGGPTMGQHSQFFRINGYGRQPRRGDPTWATIDHIITEVARLPRAARHIAAPKPALMLHGIPPADVAKRAIEVAERAQDSAGRKLRADGSVLFAAVASYLLPCSQLETGNALSDYLAWRKRVVDYLLAWLGPLVVSIVEHRDESHPHVHALIVPRLAADRQLDLSWHHGYAARKQAQSSDLSHGEQEKAYRQGLRECLDLYHAAVSALSGHARVGPRRTRLRRREALARKAAEDALRRARQQARSVLEAASAYLRTAHSPTSDATVALEILDAGFAEALAILSRHEPESTPRQYGPASAQGPDTERASEQSQMSGLVAQHAVDRTPGEIVADDHDHWPDDEEAMGTDFEDDPDPEVEARDLDYDDDPNSDDFTADAPNDDIDSDPD